MNYTSYTKSIPPFFKYLLGQISKVNILTFNEIEAAVIPSNVIHYQPTKDNINIFTSNKIKLSHELAHLLEVKDNKRLVQVDYGIKKYFPVSHKGQLQAIAREARTRGIQTRLVSLGFGNETLLVHRTASLLVKPSDRGIGKFFNNNEVNEWSANITATAYREWSKDRIIDSWKQKSEFINHWLETLK